MVTGSMQCNLRQSFQPCVVRQLLNSPAKRGVAAYLHAHPYTYDHLAGLAQRLSLSPDHLLPAVTALTEAGILLKMGNGPHALYALNIRDGWAESLELFFAQEPPSTPSVAQAMLLN